jgi:hypothetical protein
MSKEIKNLPASVHERLKALAKERGRPFQELFYYYAIERFLYRLSRSRYANDFVLKGGLLFLGWGIELRRPTRDIDALGYLENSIDNLVTVVKGICTQDVQPDGMKYDPGSVRGARIIEEADYQGLRIYFNGTLGEAFVQLHLDVSFGNVITPAVCSMTYPTLLGMPSILLRSYPCETAIAEKFHAMVVLDDINDRMKDFYDIWLLSQQVKIPGQPLASAIQATFVSRHTTLPGKIPTALTDEFGQTRQADWERFLRRSNLAVTDFPSFTAIVAMLREFLWPVVLTANDDDAFNRIWQSGGPWEVV